MYREPCERFWCSVAFEPQQKHELIVYENGDFFSNLGFYSLYDKSIEG